MSSNKAEAAPLSPIPDGETAVEITSTTSCHETATTDKLASWQHRNRAPKKSTKYYGGLEWAARMGLSASMSSIFIYTESLKDFVPGAGFLACVIAIFAVFQTLGESIQAVFQAVAGTAMAAVYSYTACIAFKDSTAAMGLSVAILAFLFGIFRH